MSQGKIVQCIGAVIDVEFSREFIPKVYDALIMEGSELTLEVQQQEEKESKLNASHGKIMV